MNTGASIFKTPSQDRLFILMPPVLALLLAFSLNENSSAYLLLLVVVSIFDSGHVYITAWRTWWNTGLAAKPASFFLVPAGVFFLIFFWNYFSAPFLWAFVVYFTVFHNVRQLYGIGKWFQLAEKTFSRSTDWFLYGVCGLSFLALHFRTDFHYDYYTGGDLFIYPNAQAFFVFKAAALLLFAGYLLFEIIKYIKTKKIFLNRLAFVISGMAVYMAACLTATNTLQLLAPLILTHALHYLALVVLVGTKSNPLFKSDVLKATGIVLLSLLVFGGFEYYAENNLIDIASHTLLDSIVIAVYLTPLLTHFILDAIIWKTSYPEFRNFLREKSDA